MCVLFDNAVIKPNRCGMGSVIDGIVPVGMGIYLSAPKTEKVSEDGENDRLRYGFSSMQGWRATMEDAVSSLCILSFQFVLVSPVCIVYPRKTLSLSNHHG